MRIDIKSWREASTLYFASHYNVKECHVFNGLLLLNLNFTCCFRNQFPVQQHMRSTYAAVYILLLRTQVRNADDTSLSKSCCQEHAYLFITSMHVLIHTNILAHKYTNTKLSLCSIYICTWLKQVSVTKRLFTEFTAADLRAEYREQPTWIVTSKIKTMRAYITC